MNQREVDSLRNLSPPTTNGGGGCLLLTIVIVAALVVLTTVFLVYSNLGCTSAIGYHEPC